MEFGNGLSFVQGLFIDTHRQKNVSAFVVKKDEVTLVEFDELLTFLEAKFSEK
jgi:GTP cyclohydrolase FolE2